MPNLPNVATPDELTAALDEVRNQFGPIGSWCSLVPLNSPVTVSTATTNTVTIQTSEGYEHWVYGAVATFWTLTGGDTNTPSTHYALSVRQKLTVGEVNPFTPTVQFLPAMALFGSGKQPFFYTKLWYWPAGACLELAIRNDSAVNLSCQFEYRAYRRPVARKGR